MRIMNVRSNPVFTTHLDQFECDGALHNCVCMQVCSLYMQKSSAFFEGLCLLGAWGCSKVGACSVSFAGKWDSVEDRERSSYLVYVWCGGAV